MSCFFCASKFHLSQNCDIHVSNKSRSKKIALKNCCPYCLNIKNGNHTSTVCHLNKNCYVCFSKGHNSVFCPDRFEAPNFFIPNIDEDLLPRFAQTFGPLEQRLLALLSPKMLALSVTTFKPFKIFKNIRMDGDDLEVMKKKSNHIITSLNLKTTAMTAASIEFSNSEISAIDFLNLLSFNTEILECYKLTVTSKITFADIIQRIPNIELLELLTTNVKIGKSWPKDLLKYKNCENMVYLHIQIKNMDFCVKSLAQFMKKQKQITIVVTHDLVDYSPQNINNLRETATEKLSEYFIPADAVTKGEETSLFRITAESDNPNYAYKTVEEFILKK